MLKSAGDKNFVIVLIIHVINILLLHFTFELLGYQNAQSNASVLHCRKRNQYAQKVGQQTIPSFGLFFFYFFIHVFTRDNNNLLSTSDFLVSQLET